MNTETRTAAAFAHAEPRAQAARASRLQRRRRLFQGAFFIAFLLAPALNLLRFDLLETQLWVLGQRWSLGIDAFVRGEATATETAWAILWRGFLPVLLLASGFLAVAWRWGRLYCGWLCPHFSAVEALNTLLHRTIGKFSLWDKHRTLRRDAQGRAIVPNRRYAPLFVLASLLLAFTWAITLLSYLLPPALVWGNLLHGTLSANQARFLAIGTALFTAEFVFARHLFCRFGCAVGLFQSLVWMANPKGMVVAFDRDQARDCRTCDLPQGSACDSACPMRLHPRNIKRMMFSCVQCGQCLTACESSQSAQQRAPLLTWKLDAEAVRETLRQRREERAQAASAASTAGEPG